MIPSHKAAADAFAVGRFFACSDSTPERVVSGKNLGVRMKSRLNLKPGQKGTKKLVEKYGASLIYVRYRYDEERGIRQTTVELVEAEAPWQPRTRRRDGELVAVSVGFAEKEMRGRLKGAGGKWDPEQKAWLVTYGAIRGTDLAKRIVADASGGKPGK